MNFSYKLGVIGTGLMANAILTCVLDKIGNFGDSLHASDIVIYDKDIDKCKPLSQRGVSVASSSSEVLANSKYVLLAVKPQDYKDLLLDQSLIKCSAIFSIMAGVKINTLKTMLPKDVSVVRMMPNTPCQIGCGIVALASEKLTNSSNFDENDPYFDDVLFAKQIMGTTGNVLIIDESKFDAVTSISGSGPSYVFLFADAMIKSGINAGLTLEESRLLTLETIIGSARLARESLLDMDTLVDRVSSKGGTTIEAVKSLKEDNLEEIIDRAITKCREKSKLLSLTL